MRNNTPYNLRTGTDMENTACDYLQQQGLKLLTRNFRSPFGEIDLVMQGKDCIIFTEVRFRKNDHFGNGAESITLSKQHKIARTAQRFLQQHPGATQENIRFDVVSISGVGASTSIDWIENAFEPAAEIWA